MSEGCGGSQLLVGLCAVAVLSGLNNGWSLKVGGLVFVRLQDAYSIGDPLYLTQAGRVLLGGGLFAGMSVGAPAVGLLAHRIGTRLSSLVGEVIIIVAIALGTFAATQPVLIMWRVLLGVGAGLCITAKPLYIVETSLPAHRGRLLTLLAASIVVSQMLCELTDWALPMPSTTSAREGGWRPLIAIGFAFPTLLSAVLLIMPHSPVYLASKHSEAQPLTSAAPQQHGTSKSSSAEAAVTSASTPSNPWRLVAVLATLVLAKEANGANVLLVYSFDYLVEQFDGDRSTAHLWGVAIGLTHVLSCVVGFLLIDSPRCGRRPLAIGGCVGTAAANVLLGTGFLSQQGQGGTGRTFDLLLPAVLLLHAFASVSVHVAFYPLTTELMPLRLRTTWLGVVYAVAQAVAFGMISIGGVAPANSNANGALYLAYGAVSAACAATLYLILEETRPGREGARL